MSNCKLLSLYITIDKQNKMGDKLNGLGLGLAKASFQTQ
jgi:hypothetical protein